MNDNLRFTQLVNERIQILRSLVLRPDVVASASNASACEVEGRSSRLALAM